MIKFVRDCWDENRIWFWKWCLEFYIAIWATVIGILEITK